MKDFRKGIWVSERVSFWAAHMVSFFPLDKFDLIWNENLVEKRKIFISNCAKSLLTFFVY